MKELVNIKWIVWGIVAGTIYSFYSNLGWQWALYVSIGFACIGVVSLVKTAIGMWKLYISPLLKKKK